MTAGTRLFNARSVRWLDIGVVVWLVVWAALGVLIWHDIRAQAELSQNVVKIGSAVRDTGDALGVVGGLPLVGGSIGSFADKIKKTGSDVMTSGRGQPLRHPARRDRERHRRRPAAGSPRPVAVRAGAAGLAARRAGGARPASCRRPATPPSSTTWRVAPSTCCRGMACMP